MLAASINPSNINRIEGIYPTGPPAPAVSGNEGVREVIAVADGVENLAVNDWNREIKIQNALKWCLSALVLSIGLTVVIDSIFWQRWLWQKMEVFWFNYVLNRSSEWGFLLSTGDLVVQNGATSIVGQCIIQLAHLRGLRTANIVKESENGTMVTYGGMSKKLLQFLHLQ